MPTLKLAVIILLNLGFPVAVWSYIPASPTNSTPDAIAGGLNVTDTSTILLQWYSNGSYSEHVSRQLMANGSSGITKGVFVHFSEDTVNDSTPATTAPWITLISCEANSTSASKTKDIFTLAHEKGAVSALLYSLSSAACIIHTPSSPPTIDVVTTQSGVGSHIIESQFGQLILPLNSNSTLVNYDSAQLNNSVSDITTSIEEGSPLRGFLLATVNITSPTYTTGGSASGGGTAKSPSGANASPKVDRNVRMWAVFAMISLFLLV